jgi:glycosyltransferase involved in cell wall biosynthesis
MKFSSKKKSVIYVNFSPYENTGNILDYILDHFSTVLLFSFNFHKLGTEQSPSMLTIYKNANIVHKNHLFQSPISPSLAFIMLPIRSIIIISQILYHTYRFRNKYGPFDIYFTVNAFTAWTGIVLKRLNLIKKTIFWVWDYYPPVHKSKMVMFMRWMYWLFDKPVSIYADRTVFLNQRIYLLRKNMNILPKNEFATVGIGTNPIFKPKKNPLPLKLAFLGVLKRSQGLDLVFDSAKKLNRTFPGISLIIIGGGPDEYYYKELAKRARINVFFYGYIIKDSQVKKILSSCHIGIATYIPEKGNVSYYGDPSKIKQYLSVGLPVITTNVFEFSNEITLSGAGIVIPYHKKELLIAITTIMKNYSKYKASSVQLAKKYYFKNLYKNLLN